jgi:hypothetical protein
LNTSIPALSFRHPEQPPRDEKIPNASFEQEHRTRDSSPPPEALIDQGLCAEDQFHKRREKEKKKIESRTQQYTARNPELHSRIFLIPSNTAK